MSFIIGQLKKYKSIIAYLVFGVLTTAVNVAVYHVCCKAWGIGNIAATVIAWVAAVTFAFVTNKPFVFGSRSWAFKTVLSEAKSFFACRAGTGVLEVIIMAVFVDMLHFNGTVMKLAANVIVIILNYIAGKLLIFRRGTRDE